MSSDNGIYILRTLRARVESPRGVWGEHKQHYVWRVAEAGAIENFNWYKEHQPYNLGAYMMSIWGGVTVYPSAEEAMVAAQSIHAEILSEGYAEGYNVEYGVGSIDTDYIFYTDM